LIQVPSNQWHLKIGIAQVLYSDVPWGLDEKGKLSNVGLNGSSSFMKTDIKYSSAYLQLIEN
jgi:hypothetical protein